MDILQDASTALPPTDVIVEEHAELVPESDDEDVCAELAELFGEEVDVTPPPSPPPEPAEVAPSNAKQIQNTEQPRPGILERLLAKEGGQLSKGVAGIVSDARAALGSNGVATSSAIQTASQASARGLTGSSSSGGVTLNDVVRKRKRRQDIGPGAEGAAQKKAKNAFAVLGRVPESRDAKHVFDDPQWTGMKLRDCSLPASSLGALFEAFTVLNIADLADKAVEVRSGAIRDALIFGALVRKAGKRTAKGGGRYAVWTLANMPLQSTSRPPPLTTVNCLLFDTAFEKHHMAPEGTVFAIRGPTVLPPREQDDAKKRGHVEQSGLCVSVKKADAVVALAHAADYAICDVERPGNGARCGQWFHKGYSSRCHYHTRQLLKRHTQSARMVINNAVRPGADTKAVFKSATAPVNVSEQAADAGHVDRYAATMIQKDAIQIARARDDERKLASLRAAQVKSRNSITRARVLGTERAMLASYRTARKPAARTQPKTPQAKLLASVSELVGLGYRLAQDGTLHPPSDGVCAKRRIDVAACVNTVQGRMKQLAKKPSTAPSASVCDEAIEPKQNQKLTPAQKRQVSEKENGKPSNGANTEQSSTQHASGRKTPGWLKTQKEYRSDDQFSTQKEDGTDRQFKSEKKKAGEVHLRHSTTELPTNEAEIELSDSSDED